MLTSNTIYESEMSKLSEKQKQIHEEFYRRFEADSDKLYFLKNPIFLLRWLRARKFDINKAEAMLREHLKYRKVMHLDDESPVKKIAINPQFAKYFTRGDFGQDNEGRPVVYFPFGGIDPKGTIKAYTESRHASLLSSFKGSQMLLTMLIWQEETRLLCEQLSKEKQKCIFQAIYILDLKGIGSQHLWKPGVDIFLQIASNLEQHAPEILYKLYVINAPSIFNMIYSIIRPVLDENTKRKIQILGDDYKEALQKDIPAKYIPAYYGGHCYGNNSDPKCTHKISYGGLVPRELYFNDCYRPADIQEITIGRQSQKLIPLHVTNSNSVLNWYIKSTSNQDIGVGIYFTADQSLTSVDEMEMITPYFRLQMHMVPEFGSLKVEKNGYCKSSPSEQLV
ncbi:SEC14-like protein 2 [Trichinella sp. T9]|nr:SEC14-like protein 2 [Trichinella sp. T9]